MQFSVTLTVGLHSDIDAMCYSAERKNNFPPLPSWCPVQPCFYQDLSVEIPLEFQRIVRLAYYFWIGERCLDALFL